MPEFIPEHTPRGLDDFTRGYLEAVEWLLPEETDVDGNVIGPVPRDRIEGFAPSAVEAAKADCAHFMRYNEDKLALYEELSGRPLNYAGHDFYLSRCEHGAGFFDRGDEPVFNELQDAAEAYGVVYHEVRDDGLIYQD